MPELKPCPFCGSPMVSAWSGLVQCDECHATIAGDTQEDSVSLWNRRVVTPAQVEALASFLWMEQGSPPQVYINQAHACLRAAGFEVQS